MMSVKKREVFYLAGYDPRGGRHYYNLYKKEALKQSKNDNIQRKISSKKRVNINIHNWQIDTITTHTNYNFLEWDDIIRNEWEFNILSIFTNLIYAMRVYLFSGIIFKYGKVSPLQMIAAFYPVVYLFLTLYISYLIAFSFLEVFLNIYISLPLAVLSMFIAIELLIKLGNRLAVFWLLRIYVFSANYVLTDMKELDKRINKFAKEISDSINSAKDKNIDEVLIVSHSVGTIIMIPILEKALTLTDGSFKNISIMSLGECIPLVSFLKEAKEYRDSMKNLVLNQNITWIDYTSSIDGACFPLLDYYFHSNVDVDKLNLPHFLSPKFHTLYTKESYAKLKKDRYLAHFLYLMATEKDNSYNFFNITSGDRYLSSYIK